MSAIRETRRASRVRKSRASIQRMRKERQKSSSMTGTTAARIAKRAMAAGHSIAPWAVTVLKPAPSPLSSAIHAMKTAMPNTIDATSSRAGRRRPRNST